MILIYPCSQELPWKQQKGLVYKKIGHIEALLTHEDWKYILTTFTFATEEMQVPCPTARQRPGHWFVVPSQTVPCIVFLFNNFYRKELLTWQTSTYCISKF